MQSPIGQEPGMAGVGGMSVAGPASVAGRARPAITKTVTAFALDNDGFAANGTLRPADTSCALPTTAMDRFWLGGVAWAGAANYLHDVITSAAFWPMRLPETDLQALSA